MPAQGALAWRLIHDGTKSIDDSDEPELERIVGRQVDGMLACKGILVDGESRRRLLLAVRDVMRDVSALLGRRAEGDYSPDANAARFPTSTTVDAGASVTSIVRDWKAEASKVGTSEATITKYERIVQRFIAFLDHDDACAVTAQDVIRYKDHRLREEGASAKTIKDSDLAAMKAVFASAVANGRMRANPATGVTLKAPTKKHGYSEEAATAILRAAFTRRPKRPENPKFSAALKWALLLCAHSGARIGEKVQLRKEDIRQRAGVWTMTLTPEAGPIKNRQPRDVPLHPQIVQLGFPQSVCEAHAGYLFLDGAEPAQFLARHRTLKNRLGDFARSVVKEAKVPANHGWRHAFIT